jgi:hypothetical protein
MDIARPREAVRDSVPADDQRITQRTTAESQYSREAVSQTPEERETISLINKLMEESDWIRATGPKGELIHMKMNLSSDFIITVKEFPEGQSSPKPTFPPAKITTFHVNYNGFTTATAIMKSVVTGKNGKLKTKTTPLEETSNLIDLLREGLHLTEKGGKIHRVKRWARQAISFIGKTQQPPPARFGSDYSGLDQTDDIGFDSL